MENQDRKPAPPYLSFTTLNNFIDGLSVHMPTRIDKSLMRSMSGASQAALVSALDYLGLRDDEKPTKALEDLAAAKGADRGPLWKKLIVTKYPFLFEDGFELKRATQSQLDERFKEYGITGETIRKCVAFFMAAAQTAGIEVSPHFRSIKSRTPRSFGTRPATIRRRVKREAKSLEQTPEPDSASYVAASVTLSAGVIVELRVTGSAFALAPADRTDLFKWIDEINARAHKSGSADSDSTAPAS